MKNKKNILYSISSDGLGHTNRSIVVIDYLKNKYNIFICTGENTKAYNFLKKRYKNIFPITPLKLKYRSNKIDKSETFKNIFKSRKELLNNLKDVEEIIKKNKIDFIISDFEPFSLQIAKYLEIPSLAIDHQNLFLRTKVEFDTKYFFDYLLTKMISKMMCPYANYYFIVSFYKPKIIKKRTTIVHPLIKDELYKIKPKKGNYILVYNRFEKDINKITKILSSFKNEKFIVFGLDINKKIKNITFKKATPTLYKYISKSSAVITNGGHTLITEALFYKKPVLSIPIQEQFEQISNAYYLQKKGFGLMCEKFNIENIQLFLNNLNSYNKKLRKYKYQNKNKILKKIEKKIKYLIKKQKKKIKIQQLFK